MNKGIINLTDSYKVTHWKQYPKDTRYIHSYMESRGGKWPEVNLFGSQYYAKKYLVGQRVFADEIEKRKRKYQQHFMGRDLFNEAGWRYILEKHDGRLPVSIKTVLEGTTVPTSNVLMTVENTDPNCWWLPNYLESLLLKIWYPSTVVTNGRMVRKRILEYLIETGTPKDVDFKFHDFGFRGSDTVETAGIGGCAHLVNFNGTDTLEALDYAEDYYGEEMAGFSIPAAEHSTITAWRKVGEVLAYENMLNQYPDGYVAVVSDSYDIYHACREIWGRQLRDRVLSRNGVVVVRPDSGDPPTVIKKISEILGEEIGYERNAKGYKVLDPHIRLIQGDKVDYGMVGDILHTMKQANWSADNIGFGSGGANLQEVARKDQDFSFKCSARNGGGVWHDVSKDPATDSGKRSKPGRLKLVLNAQGYRTVRIEDNTDLPNQLVEIFRDGKLLADQTFSDIRKRARL